MADNVPVTAGSGTDIATDDIAGVHYQKVKIALGADNALDTLVDSGQQTMANSVPVVLASDHSDVKVTLDSETVGLAAGTNNIGDVDVASLPNGLLDSFGHLIIGEINNDIDVQFYRATSDSDLSNIITETEANGGTASRSNGMATFATTTTASSRAKGVSLVPVVYTAGAEVYAIFTAAFPTATGGTGSYRRIGLYNDLTDGLFIGYETTGTFGLSIVKGGSQVTTLKADFSTDTLVGGVGSKFTRAGTPEAINLTLLNVFRIRFGWVGSAPIKFEVLSPDGNWVLFHTILQPNLAAVPSLNTADLSFTCDVATGTSGNAQSILTNCWGAGTTQKLRKLTDTLSDNTLAGLTRSVIVGAKSGGGGPAYVNAKVTPSGALVADVTNAGTFAVQESGSALTALQLLDDVVKTDDAGFTVGTDEVAMSGCVAVAHGTNPDAADANDAVATLANRHRVQFTIGGHPNVVTVKHTNITTAVTDTAMITVGAGAKIVVTRITVSLDNASTVFPTVLIGFGTATTPTTTGVIFAHGGFPAGGQATIGDGSGIIGIGADNEDLRITTTGNATGNGLQVTISYYTIES